MRPVASGVIVGGLVMSLLLLGTSPAVAGTEMHVCDPSIFPTEARKDVTDRLRQAIGGGQFQSGPFIFCLFLYADPDLHPKADHPSRMTDLPGIGWSALWVYQGSGVSGRFAESYGALPGRLQPIAGYDRILQGDWGGRFGGGMVLPKGSKPGDRLHLAISMSAPAETFGGQFSFTLMGQGVAEITVFPWSEP